MYKNISPSPWPLEAAHVGHGPAPRAPALELAAGLKILRFETMRFEFLRFEILRFEFCDLKL